MKKTFTAAEIIIFAMSFILLAGAILFRGQMVTGILISIGLLVLLIIVHVNTPKIAGLSPDNPKVKTMRRMNAFTAVFITVIGVVQLVPQWNAYFMNADVQFWILIALMVGIGNVAPKLPYNRNIGLRLPWTVHNENSWKVAHRLLGYITFPLVLLMIGFSFVAEDVKTVVVSGVLTWIIIPGVVSLVSYYKTKTNAGKDY